MPENHKTDMVKGMYELYQFLERTNIRSMDDLIKSNKKINYWNKVDQIRVCPEDAYSGHFFKISAERISFITFRLFELLS
jgi:hypothetical protein